MRTIASRWVFAGLCFLPSFTLAAFPPSGFKEVDSEKSPQSTFKIIHYQRDPENDSSESQIWLQAAKPGFKTQLLFTYHNSANWRVAPDEHFIAINHHVMDGLGELNVFSLSKDGLFHEAREDFLEAASKRMVLQLGLKAKAEIDHKACLVDAWLREGVFLGHLVGNTSGVSELKPWYFVYDLNRHRFSWDLSALNQGAFSLYPRK